MQDEEALIVFNLEMAYGYSNRQGSLDDADQLRLCHVSMGSRVCPRLYLYFCTANPVNPHSYLLHHTDQCCLLPDSTRLVNDVLQYRQEPGDQRHVGGWINLSPPTGQELQRLSTEPFSSNLWLGPLPGILIFAVH